MLVLLVLVMLAGVAGAQAAEDENLPETVGMRMRDTARITFEWPEPVGFKVKAKGTTLTITFPQKVNPSFGQVLSSLYPYVVSAKRKADGRTIVLTLDKPYKIRTFQAEAISGVDILGLPAQEARVADALEEALLSPSAGEKDAAPADNSAPTDGSAQTEAEAATGMVALSVSAQEDTAVLRFPFRDRVAMAAFVRNKTLWVVLGKKVKLDISEFDNMPKTVIDKGELMAGNVTILRVPVHDGVYPSVTKDEDSFEWGVMLSSSRRAPANALKVDINTDPPVPPHVFVNALQMADAVNLRDPVVGDELVIIPTYGLGEGVPFRREFVDFQLLTTAEGIAIAKKTDELTVSALRNGLRISLPQGAILTPGLPKVDKVEVTEALQSVPTLFPNDKWALPAELPERALMRDMITKIAEAPTPQDANDQRLRLAQAYLSLGMGPEALAMLDGIRRTDVSFYRSGNLAALHGSANFLLQRYNEALRDFNASELSNNKETDFWRNMLSDLLGKEGKYDYLAMHGDYISRYPVLFRQRIAVVAADRAVDTKEYNTAIKIFETLAMAGKDVKEANAETKAEGEAEADAAAAPEALKKAIAAPNSDLLAPVGPYIRFLMAKIAADTGQADEALKELTVLADDYKHPYVRSRAEYSRIILEMNRDIINKTQVVERLERLRLAWHGDSLELKVLNFLGEIYADNKDWVNAMRIWENAAHAYAGTPKSAELHRKMEETFVRMFKEGTADALTPLEALALYYQYKTYAPPGAVGREMTANLADRLVSIDLLDQAASLLEHQMRNDAEKIQRSQIGAKVATIYLLNHEPKKALRALEDSVYGENPLGLHQLRNRLAAESLMQLGDTDKAWQILAHDETVDAERIRLSILWEKRDWARIVHTVENLLKARKDIAAPITVEESEHVIQLALAYIFENNKEQLQYLRDYFTPLMANNPNKALFDFITATDITPTPTNFDDVVKNMLATRSFIDNYKAQIKTAGLSAVVPPASVTP
ncbi:MAG: hypothetical protein K2Q01_11750 [Rickettsiales bacterium]|nr:hypothetical protein [Rickettsiales bacterium]